MAVFAKGGESAARRSRRAAWNLLLAPLVVVTAGVALAAAGSEAYAHRALPGLSVGDVPIGSLEEPALRDRLQAELVAPWSAANVTLTDGARRWRTTNAELGIAPDLDAAVAGALAYGKTGSIMDRANAWIDAIRGEAKIPFAMRASGDSLDRFVASLARDLDRAPVSGELLLTAAGLDARRPQLGTQVDRNATVAALLSADSLGDREATLRSRAVYPDVDASGFDEAYARASAVVTPLIVRVDDRSWSESPASLATLLVIERVAAKPGDLPPVPGEAIAPAARYRYTATLANGRVAEWASALAKVLDHPGRPAKFQVSATGDVAIIPSESGVRIDTGKLRALLLDQLVRPANGATRELAAPAAVDSSRFTSDQAKELLPKLTKTSSFTTYYPPSPSRHANISTGASQFDGVVIMPGQTFSFWELLGPVTVERGYAYAGAIINNRSDENVIGGGLCQVSTTIFNAVSAQGYEIVERHAHGYYIDRYPIGYDAAVFEPGVDLKWRNDTANPVFIWSWSGNTFLTIEVWSIPTGRTVVVSDPVQRNFVKPAADQLADPAFPAGVSVDGRDVFRSRTVYENGKVLHQDPFASHYVPVWGGPVKAPPSPPTP